MMTFNNGTSLTTSTCDLRVLAWYYDPLPNIQQTSYDGFLLWTSSNANSYYADIGDTGIWCSATNYVSNSTWACYNHTVSVAGEMEEF